MTEVEVSTDGHASEFPTGAAAAAPPAGARLTHEPTIGGSDDPNCMVFSMGKGRY
jgi:hypothetical protein